MSELDDIGVQPFAEPGEPRTPGKRKPRSKLATAAALAPKALRVSDILDARPAVRKCEILSVAPAMIMIAEIGAPLRIATNCMSEAERDALYTHVETDRGAAALASAFSFSRTTTNGEENLQLVEAERRHGERLEAVRNPS